MGQTEPISGSSSLERNLPAALAIVKEVLASMSKPVPLLDVTTPSQFRKDGHLSIYLQPGKQRTDCVHWCLSGVPDTWNQLLYAMLVTSGN